MCLRLLTLLFVLLLINRAFGSNNPQSRPLLIPTPRTLTMQQGLMTLTAHVHIIATKPDLAPLAQILSDEMLLTTGVRVAPSTNALAFRDNIILSIDPRLAAEAYTVNVDRYEARITGGSCPSVAEGTVTLLQSLQALHGAITIPCLNIEDSPAFAYRGAMIDLGRKYHTPAGIEQVIELCRLYKIRFLHLHLSDDQLFMFPSTAYPQTGKSNREFARFEPGSKPHIEPYTVQELRGLERYAHDRGVYLVPEIDLPGHSGRMIADAGDVFGIPGNGSTVNVANPKTIEALTTLLNEVMDVFQSTPYIHLGADEVGLDGLDRTPEYRDAQAKYGIKSVHELYCKFVKDMHDVIAKRGKKTIVWEEACNADGPYPLPKDTLVMIWSQGRNPNDIVRQGYKVINATWTPLYIVRNNRRSPEFLFDWAAPKFGREGSTDYTELDDAQNLVGAQLCSWEDSEAIEIQSLRERLAVVAERTWYRNTTGAWPEFEARFKHTDALLEKLISPVSITAKAIFKPDENTFTTPLTLTLTATNPQPGLTLKYTLDNSLPNTSWQTYTSPLTVEKTVYLRAGLFDTQGQQHGYLVGSWYRSAIAMKPNLATNKQVTVGPGPNRNDEWAASNAVDGHTDDPMRHWASVGEAPQWLMVDLGKPLPVNYINVITYWDGGRYYQWNAEVSEDGIIWKQVLDFSRNTAVATANGYSGRFQTTNARYVRINMLKNSANPFVHIVELIVENKK